MDNFLKLDRGAFSAMTIHEADGRMNDYSHYAMGERFAVFHYLNSVCYNHPINDPPRMERVFSGARKLIDAANSK
jgi:hypothetical protein